MNLQKRNSALDILRIAALFSVVGVHFFLNMGYYYTPMAGKRMLLMTVMRSGFMVCVPMFIMLTGYLMNKKTLSGKYYKGIIKTLVIYFITAALCFCHNKYYLGMELSLFDGVKNILGYSGANYSWYIGMYIGLFLLAPFINVMYHGITTKGGKLALIGTLLLLSSAPAAVNLFMPILPEWWVNLYPVTYYLMGAYLCEYPLKLKKLPNILLIFVGAGVLGVVCYIISRGGNFKWHPIADWFSLPVIVISVLTFCFFANRDTSRFGVADKKILAVLSDACLGAYLMSYIFDSIIYPKFTQAVPNVLDRINYFLPITVTVLVLSLAASCILNLLYAGIKKLVMLACGKKKGNQ